MSRTCTICNRPDRAEIENLLLRVGVDNPTLTISSIALAFDIDEKQLRVHALMHTPLALGCGEASDAALLDTLRSKTPDDAEAATSSASGTAASVKGESAASFKTSDSMGKNLKLRESDLLLETANEYLTTMKNIGRRINRMAATQDETDQRFERLLSNSMVSLYLGCGGEVRQAVKGILEYNTAINGTNDPAAQGLAALAAALKPSITASDGGSQFADNGVDYAENASGVTPSQPSAEEQACEVTGALSKGE